MPEQPPAPGPLTPTQLDRIGFARRDPARFEDASQLDDAGLILLVERLRERLDDMLHLIAEVCDTEPPHTPDPTSNNP